MTVRLGRARPGRLLSRFGRYCARHQGSVLGFAAAAALLLGLAAADVTDHLSNGGYNAAGTQSARADRLLAQRFGTQPPDLVLLADTKGKVDDERIADHGRHLTRELAEQPDVASVRSYWSPHSSDLRSRDRRTALIAVVLAGGDARATRTAERLVPRARELAEPFTLSASGPAWTNVQFIRQGQEDQRRAEIIVVPITILILLATFGSVYAAMLPAIVGALAVIGTLAVMRLLTQVMSVSVLVPNLATAIGFGLAIDYSLFLVTRYREELSEGATVPAAIERAMGTAGRTVLFSAVTVMVALSGLLAFPLGALRSLACTAMTVVLMAAASALLVLPALLALIGTRINRYDAFGRLRRPPPRRRPPLLLGGTVLSALGMAALPLTSAPRRARMGGILLGPPLAWIAARKAARARRAAASPYEIDSRAWRLAARAVTRRPALIGGGCALFLVLLAVPFGHARFGLTDERSLPAGVDAHAVAERVARDFAEPLGRGLTVVLPDTPCRSHLDRYARGLSAQPHVIAVKTSTGEYRKDRREGDAPGRYTAKGAVMLNVSSKLDPQSPDGKRLVERVRAVDPPGSRYVTGASAHALDTLTVLERALPKALAIIAACTFVLLFLFTGGLLVSAKALVLGALSLSASFGAVVWVFQDGHAKDLVGGFTVTGRLDAMTLLLAFTIAFGLSIDYEVFLLSRIKEVYAATGRHTESIVTGIARTGRLVTAAALVVAVSMGAMLTSSNTVLKMNGLGLALAVLVDATLVRGLLVPAFMQLTGPANWWAPPGLARLHRRTGLAEAPARRIRRPRI
ncbi:MMPL family transporter [Actinomadura sp. 9N407]|uniref:MMPL family transporter n=1 Tax=Actinomadura sp. 9N407 TaxID=3375154 RepID=UPI0037BB69BB